MRKSVRIALVLAALGLAIAPSSPAISSEVKRYLDGKQPKAPGKKPKTAIDVPGLASGGVHAGTQRAGQAFRLQQVVIEGATTISYDLLSHSYARLINRQVTAQDLHAITETLTGIYKDAGFTLTRAFIPRQDIVNGTVRIRVIEGYIGEVAVAGADAVSFGIDSQLAGLMAERPLRQRTLERHLLLVNDIPGVKVIDAVLDELGDYSGRFRLTVRVETWGVYVAAALQNRGTPAVGRVEGSVSTALNSLVTAGDTIGLGVSTTPFQSEELRAGQFSYAAPLGSQDAIASIAYAYGLIAPGDERRIRDTRTKSQRLAVAANVVAARSRALSISLRLGGDITDVEEQDDTGTFSDDRIRAITAGTDVEVHDSLGGIMFASAQMRHGLDQFGATKKNDLLASRDGASGSFTSAQLSATRFQKLTDEWSLALSAAGQVSSAPLLSIEEFYVGGGSFGRAFDGGVIGGDSGIAGSVELRFDQEIALGPMLGYQLYGFLDHGHVWNKSSGTDAKAHLTSAGGGVRFYLAHELEAELEFAAPIDESFDATGVRDWSVYFSLSKDFKFCNSSDAASCFSTYRSR